MKRIHRYAILALAIIALTSGCRPADALLDGVTAGVSETVSTLIVSLLLPDTH